MKRYSKRWAGREGREDAERETSRRELESQDRDRQAVGSPAKRHSRGKAETGVHSAPENETEQ